MSEAVRLETGDAYKDEVQNQWDRDPCGSQYVEKAKPDTLEWFLEVEQYRYGSYGPWMAKVMEFDRHAGEHILEIGAGIGTDHAQFAKNGGIMHDLDLSSGHLNLAKRNFELRGLKGSFHHGDGENIPFPDDTFDLVYSNGVIHHTPNTATVVKEIYRVLKPSGRCIIMVYAENSLHYWRNLFLSIGLGQRALESMSMGEIMSRHVELSEHGSKPLVKVYTGKRLRKLFGDFENISIHKRQLTAPELPSRLKWIPLGVAGRLMGWNLIIKARKPARSRSRREKSERPASGSRDEPSPRPSFAQELAKSGISFADWLAERRTSKRLYVEEAIPRLNAVRQSDPRTAKAIIASANAFLSHRFDILGSGPFVPVDPDRPLKDGYTPIDWYLDPVRKLRFPCGIPHKDWKLFEMRPQNADIKYPWELSRCQHWMTLAQAWQLSRDDRYAVEVARQLDDFVEANPVGIGINWTCAMDVSVRVANWCLSLSLLRDCEVLYQAFWMRAYDALFDHGSFIFENLENEHEVTSNHFLSNVVGLHILAGELANLEQGRAWDLWCRKALETEIEVQVHAEGSDFESSIPYHRLVTELFLASACLARHQRRPLSAHYERKLASMVDFSLATTRPDGLMPVIGDADDGRLHIFSYVENWNRQDARHLLGPAAYLLNRPDWLPYAGPHAAWEAAWWGFDSVSLAGVDALPPPPVAKLFADVGIAVARREGNYLAVTNGAVGTKGYGNHKHNELLGFEYHCNGVPLVVDPGSFVYTSDFAARNVFRSTGYHSTLLVDETEQNEINPEWLFRMFEKAQPEHLGFSENEGRVVYCGRHRGFERLPSPVVHEREFRFDMTSGALQWWDRLDGRGSHELRWHLHLAPGVEARQDGPEKIRLETPSKHFLLSLPAKLSIEIDEAAWYSPSYGVRRPTTAIDMRCHTNIEQTKHWKFGIKPDDAPARYVSREPARSAAV